MVTAKRRHPLGRVLVTHSQMLTWIAAQRPLMGVERTWRGLCPLMTQSRHPRARHGGHTRLPLTVTGYYGLVIDRWTPIHLSLTDRVGPSAILTAGTIMFWLYRGDFHVEAILPIIVQIVTGVLGGQAVGAVLQQVAMSQLTKIISGAVGGVAGGTILGSLLGGAAGVDPASGGALGGLLGNAIGGAGGGAILTAIVGAVMKAMNK